MVPPAWAATLDRAPWLCYSRPPRAMWRGLRPDASLSANIMETLTR